MIDRTFLKFPSRTIVLISACRSLRATTMISSTQAARSNAWMVWAMTGLPAIVANNLSKPMRRLLPAATMMAVSMDKARNAQRSTSNTQSRIQKSAVQRWVFGVERWAFASLQLLLHLRAQRFAINATGHFRLQRFHHCAHLRSRARACFGNCFTHNLRNFIGAHRLRQISVKNRQFFFLLFRQLCAAAFFEALN